MCKVWFEGDPFARISGKDEVIVMRAGKAINIFVKPDDLCEECWEKVSGFIEDQGYVCRSSR
jgi:hypothetical protein